MHEDLWQKFLPSWDTFSLEIFLDKSYQRRWLTVKKNSDFRKGIQGFQSPVDVFVDIMMGGALLLLIVRWDQEWPTFCNAGDSLT